MNAFTNLIIAAMLIGGVDQTYILWAVVIGSVISNDYVIGKIKGESGRLDAVVNATDKAIQMVEVEIEDVRGSM